MFIKEIVLDNFRIYKGINQIELSPTDDKNIIVVSGKNGFGKTTFLMSLVWCLYGKQMEKVDELYKKEIGDQGGYIKYIENSLNRLAKYEEETKFSVSITFGDVKVPDITCSEIKITRSYDTNTSTSDKIEVLVDGSKSELIQNLTPYRKQPGEDIFIQKFILPIEIAKFFFFDAEKIVSLAEINSLDQKKLLSKAYTEVLGIKKYEDLKETLDNLQDDYRKKSAKPKEKADLTQIGADIEKTQIEIDSTEKDIQELKDEKTEKNNESRDIQEKLVEDGNQMSSKELHELKEKESSLDIKLRELQSDLKESFDLTPFGLAGENLMEVSTQLKDEQSVRKNELKQEDVNEKVKSVLDDLEASKKTFSGVIKTDIRNFYENEISKLIKKHFSSDTDEIPNDFKKLHDFSDSETNELNTLIDNLKGPFKEKIERLNNEYSSSKRSQRSIRTTINSAEKNAENEYALDLREQKEKLDKCVLSIDDEIYSLVEKKVGLISENKRSKKEQTILKEKIDDSRKYSEISKKVEDLIKSLKIFIKSFKEEKKKSLEENLLNQLTTLMHKKDLIKRVVVDINHSGDDVDINLYGMREEKIEKGALSMGERQMYASALLKALVDESDIEFPVFIDSPMQKFDKDHVENVIKAFYPNISKQVVLFPLIHTELTKDVFTLLKPKISKSYIINNTSTEYSEFLEVQPENLINKYDELYAN